MEHFVTLFNKFYVVQGVALYLSLRRNVGNFTLWILCVDAETYLLLKNLNLPSIRLLRMSEFETDDLKAVKPNRTIGEYCWTLTPFAPRFVFQSDSTVAQVTYVDADLWFRRDPKIIYQEFQKSQKSVLITDHGYSPQYDQSATSGQFCVQFIIFKREDSEIVRSWWEKKCLHWCYARYENNLFGDQKYLEQWPILFEQSVHVLKRVDVMLAPWNAIRFPYGNSIVWHAHNMRLVANGNKLYADFGSYLIPKPTFERVLLLYKNDLTSAIKMVLKIDSSFTKIYSKRKWEFKKILRRFYFKMQGLTTNTTEKIL